MIDPDDPNHHIPTLQQGRTDTRQWGQDRSIAVKILVLDQNIIFEITLRLTIGDGGIIFELIRGHNPASFTPVENDNFWKYELTSQRNLIRNTKINEFYYHQWLGCVELVPVFPAGGGSPYISIFEKDINGDFTQVQRNQEQATTIMQQRHSIENFLHWLHGDPSPFRPQTSPP
ncbi:MAG: hypothetical protein JW839_21250 [Candidatus Lokiarchaeota archaeon]|nr:hypothetical protein [Candidatus Lokiarchaeota archaeon]